MLILWPGSDCRNCTWKLSETKQACSKPGHTLTINTMWNSTTLVSIQSLPFSQSRVLQMRQQGTQGDFTVAYHTTCEMSTVQQPNTSVIWSCVHISKCAVVSQDARTHRSRRGLHGVVAACIYAFCLRFCFCASLLALSSLLASLFIAILTSRQ